MSETDRPVLEAIDITKSFPGVVALSDVSLTVHRGTVHALVGENGAGKSTLIKVLTGVHSADSGDVRLNGEPVDFTRPSEAQHAGISTVYQEVNLVPLMSVARNIFLGREPTRRGLIDFAQMNEKAEHVLTTYGIDVDVRRPLRSLGMGVQQMVAVARAISLKASVVVMDEPTSSLEPREVEKLFDVIRRLKADGVSVIYVSHRMEELYTICEQVTVLRDGRRVHTGPLLELPRLELVATMLGREVAEVRSHGTTGYADAGHDVTAETPVLVVRNLTRRPAVAGVSFDVRPGEVLGLGGLLGAGRSETVKAVSGVDRAESGDVRVAGRHLRSGSTGAAISAGIALLPEDRKTEGIIPELSVRENIVLAAMPRLSRAGLVSEGRQRRVVDTLMKRLRIKASSPEQKVRELSGGNQQKVLLARLLCLSPKVLLLDEPTRGIDVGAKAEVQALVEELAQDGIGVVLISSEVEELLEGSDRVVVLKDGVVVDELRGEGVSGDALMAALAAEPGTDRVRTSATPGDRQEVASS